MQPRDIKFPVHMTGNQYRTLDSSLYDRYPLIEYSRSEDAIYCYHCRHVSTNTKESAFVSHGLRSWKKCCEKMAATTSYCNTILAFNMPSPLMLTRTTWLLSLALFSVLQSFKILVRENRIYVRTLCEVLLLTAHRKIAQRKTGRS